AIGKKLSLILLLESGIQEPGGLQGDIEYISFDREHPTEAFRKMFEMIATISPRLPALTSMSSETRSPSQEQKSEGPAAPTGEDWWMPKPEWNRSRYEGALFLMVEAGDEEKARSIYEAYLNTEEATQADNKQNWEAFAEYVRLRFGRGGSLAKLKTLA